MGAATLVAAQSGPEPGAAVRAAVIIPSDAPSSAAKRLEEGRSSSAELMLDYAEFRLGNSEPEYFVETSGAVRGEFGAVVGKLSVLSPLRTGQAQVEAQLRYARTIGAKSEFFVGARSDLSVAPSRHYLLTGATHGPTQGVELEAALFLSDKGNLFAQVEGAADVDFGDGWIIQPKAVLMWSGQDLPDEDIGRGASQIELGLRMGREVLPGFQPYLGVGYVRSVGRSADYIRGVGDDPTSISFLAGAALALK